VPLEQVPAAHARAALVVLALVVAVVNDAVAAAESPHNSSSPSMAMKMAL
jgi:hypothetical protein